jgi:hypothetical protein
MEIEKKQNIWQNIPEVSEDDVKDGGKEEVSDICIATKTDGKPCQGIKYKDTQYCYNHLMKTKVRPRGRPPKVITDLAPVVVPVVAPVASSHSPSNAGDQVAPVAPRTEPRAPSRVVSPRTSSNDLVEKLSIRLKQKVEGLDDEMKVLLRMLL